ncbi:MAG: hypothetical protein QNJ77_03390 [Acidimicrobiia bacterium]|nr:hypothetical protein [Acidimicrobiia bacterium]
MMHEHDQELIMALAEGTLDPAAAARAEIELAGCDECLRDLELQRVALATLAEAPDVYLTATESARLHERLHQELRVPDAQVARPRPSAAWGRWAALAAGAAALFLAVFMVVPSMLGGSDDSADTVASEEMADEAEAADSERAETTAAAAAPSAESPAFDAAEDQSIAGAAEIETTTAAPETSASDDGAVDNAIGYLSYVVDGGLSPELRLEIVDQLAANEGFFRSGDEAVKAIEPDWAGCIAEIFETEPGIVPRIVGIIIDETGQQRLLVALVNEEDATATVLASVTIPECEIFETLP